MRQNILCCTILYDAFRERIVVFEAVLLPSCHVLSICNLGSMISSWDSCRYKDLNQINIFIDISVRMPEDTKRRKNLALKLEM